MSTEVEKGWEAAVCAVCAAGLLVCYLVCCLLAGEAKREQEPYSVCECCGKILDVTTNNVCVPEGAEGSGK